MDLSPNCQSADTHASADSDTLILVDDADREVGHLSKAQCHQGAGVLHRAFSLLIFNDAGELLLQQRAASKRLWPRYWSNSCCSHPRRAETMEAAIHRRLYEELGLRCPLHFLFKFQYQAQFDAAGAEHELCSVFIGRCSDRLEDRSRMRFSPGAGSAPRPLQAEMTGSDAGQFYSLVHTRVAAHLARSPHSRARPATGVKQLAIPLFQTYRVARYLAGRKLRGDKRYPLVLMLEPLFQCNLACAGCGKIDYPKEILQKRMSVADALRAVDECGAPMVSIPGGEPLIHREMPQIVAGIVARKKFVYLCTNAILLSKHIDEYRPSRYLTFSIHLDGNRKRHDESVCQEGVFDKAVAAIRLARSKGFRVTVNCTLFSGEDPDAVAEFFDAAMKLGIEGITVSPGYSYHHAPRQDVFLGRSASKRLFREIFKRRRGALPQTVVLQSFRAVPGFSRGQPDLSVHAVEQSDL